MLDKLIGPVTGILDKFVEDKDLRATLQHEMDMQLHNANLAQIEVNKAEASSSSLFKGGWRPFVGWTCGVALLYHFLLQPIIIFGLSAAGRTPKPDIVLLACTKYSENVTVKMWGMVDF